jgi:hypothetical protein
LLESALLLIEVNRQQAQEIENEYDHGITTKRANVKYSKELSAG